MTRRDPEEEMARCESCGLRVPYWSLDVVTLEVPTRRVNGMLVYDPHVLVRLECVMCREDD